MAIINMRYDRIIGIDLGNGLIKIKGEFIKKTGKYYRKALPSAYALQDTIGASLDEKEFDVDVFEIEGQKYVWGKDVINMKEIIYTHGHNKERYNSMPYRNMIKMVLAKVYKDLGIQQNEKVLIVTGVPSSQTGTQAEEAIKQAFTNDSEIHDVKINGEQFLIKVDAKDIIVMAQPVATVIGKYLNEDGKVLNQSYEEMKVGVVDIGGGTTDFDIIDKLRRITKDRHSVKKGFKDVYDEIRKDIKSVYEDAEPTDYELLRNILDTKKDENGKRRFLYKPNKRVDGHDYTEALKNGIKNLSAEIQNTIATIWKSQSDFDEIILVGGSANMFEEAVKHIAEATEIPKNNGDSNVDGYYKFGVYQNNKMEESVI